MTNSNVTYKQELLDKHSSNAGSRSNSENTVPIEEVKIKTYLKLVRNKSTKRKPRFDSLVARESGLGVLNMNIKDNTIITNGRCESTLNLLTALKHGLSGVYA